MGKYLDFLQETANNLKLSIDKGKKRVGEGIKNAIDFFASALGTTDKSTGDTSSEQQPTVANNISTAEPKYMTAGSNPYQGSSIMSPTGTQGTVPIMPSVNGNYQANSSGITGSSSVLKPTGNQAANVTTPDSASTVAGGAYFDGEYDKTPGGITDEGAVNAPSEQLGSVPEVSTNTFASENALTPAQKTEPIQRPADTGAGTNGSGIVGVPSVPQTGTEGEQTPSQSQQPSQPVMSYEEWMRSRDQTYANIKAGTENFYNGQQSDAEAFLNSQYNAIAGENGYAANLKNKTDELVNSGYTAAQNYAATSKSDADAIVNSQYDAIAGNEGYAARLNTAKNNAAEEQAAAEKTYAQNIKDALIKEDEENPENNGYLIKENAAAKKYANEFYDKYSLYLANKLAGDKELAASDKEAIQNMSKRQLEAIIATAERQRAEAEASAEIERQRGVVDARSSYEQNKATYGANAEAMANMGLEGGGYAEYLNSRAYAQQRAETQAANAQATAAKRQARYVKDQAEIEAQSEHNKNMLESEQAYNNRIYGLDDAYGANLMSLQQNRDDAVYAADSELRSGKYSANAAYENAVYNADSTKRENLLNNKLAHEQMLMEAEAAKTQGLYQSKSAYDEMMYNAENSKHEGLAESDMSYQQMLMEAEAAKTQGLYQSKSAYDEMMYNAENSKREGLAESDMSYQQMLLEAENALKSGKYEAKQNADAGKYAANMQYRENLLNNSSEIAAYRENQRLAEEEKAEQAAEQSRSIYSELLTGAASGSFSEDTVKSLGEKYGLSPEEISSLGNAAANYKTEYDKAENTSNYLALFETASSYYTQLEPAAIEVAAQQGQITEAQKWTLLSEMKKMAQKYWDELSAEDKKTNRKPPILSYEFPKTGTSSGGAGTGYATTLNS